MKFNQKMQLWNQVQKKLKGRYSIAIAKKFYAKALKFAENIKEVAKELVKVKVTYSTYQNEKNVVIMFSDDDEEDRVTPAMVEKVLNSNPKYFQNHSQLTKVELFVEVEAV